MADYSTHADYMQSVSAAAEARKSEVEAALKSAFSRFVEPRTVDVIRFTAMTVHDLLEAIRDQPLVLKPLIASCNIAGRAIERDLGIRNLDTYSPTLTSEQAAAIAGYIKPFLPTYIEIAALSTLDKVYFIDKEVRKGKGQWEKKIAGSLARHYLHGFQKRKFICNGDEFELDVATPATGAIKIGVDVKRIEARRDIHKRCDEIVNKAAKLKESYSGALFAAVIYYPFFDEHINIQSRLRSQHIDAVVFASDDATSIDNAVQHLLAQLRLKPNKRPGG